MGKEKKVRRNSMQKKKAVGEKMKLSSWVEVFILFSIISLLTVNSLYLDGYYCSEIAYDSGELVAASEGYQIDGSNFSYIGEGDTYFQILGGEYIEQLLISFQNAPDQDVNAEIFYTDEEGNVLDTTTTCIWEKGKAYMKVDLEDGVYDSFLVSIPADFALSTVYYAIPNGISSGKKLSFSILFIIISAFLATIVLYFKPVRELVEKTEQRVITFGFSIRDNWMKTGLWILIYGAVVGTGTLILYLFSKQGFLQLSSHLVFLLFGIGFLLILMIARYHDFSERLELMGAIAILATGAFFAFTEPPNVGVSWDDEIHYSNSVQLSHIFDKTLSIADTTIINDYVGVATEKRNYSREEQSRYNELLDVLEKSDYYIQMEDYTIGNTTIAYLPSAIGLVFARGLGLPVHLMLSIGRWMNTWLLAILCYFAMKQLKTGKIVVLLIAMIPTNLFLASSYTYDTWVTAWVMLGLAAFFGEWQKPGEKISKGKQWLIAISLYLAVFPKQVYFPMTCIAIFMPLSKFSNRKDCWKYRCLIALACLLPFVAVYIQNFWGEGMGKGDVRGGSEVDATAQLEFIKNNPKKTGQILFNYLKGYLNPFAQGGEYTTKLAYMGYIPVDFRYVLGTLFVGAIISREEKEPVKFPWWSKAGVLLVYVVIGSIAAVSMYVAFTPVGLETVNGCQGRYLIPVLFPVIYLWSRFSCKTYVKCLLKETNIHILLIAVLMLVSAWGVWNCCISLY